MDSPRQLLLNTLVYTAEGELNYSARGGGVAEGT